MKRVTAMTTWKQPIRAPHSRCILAYTDRCAAAVERRLTSPPAKSAWISAAVAALALFVSSAQAVDGVWIFNGTGTANWSETGRWTNGIVANGEGAIADFSTINITSDRTVTLDSSRTIGNLKFGDTTPTHNWSLAASGGSILTLQVSSGAPSIEVINQSAGISAVLQGTQGFTKTGVGTLSVSGNNSSFSGDITISQGALFWNNNNALGASTVTLNDVGTGGNNTGLFRNAAGTLANNIIVANHGSGTATIGSDVSQASITYSGTVTLNRNATLKAGVNPGPSTVNFNGDITGTGGVTVSGGGVVVFQSTAKSYTGGTTLIDDTTLRLGSDNVIPDTGTFTFAGGIVAANNRTDTIGQLSLTADSSLNLTPGGTAGALTFASAAWTSGTLTINGWTGTPGEAGTDDRIYFTAAPAETFLNHVYFDIGGNLYFADMIGNELVAGVTPVPEPINVALGVFGVLFGGIGLWRRHRASRSA